MLDGGVMGVALLNQSYVLRTVRHDFVFIIDRGFEVVIFENSGQQWLGFGYPLGCWRGKIRAIVWAPFAQRLRILLYVNGACFLLFALHALYLLLTPYNSEMDRRVSLFLPLAYILLIYLNFHKGNRGQTFNLSECTGIRRAPVQADIAYLFLYLSMILWPIGGALINGHAFFGRLLAALFIFVLLEPVANAIAFSLFRERRAARSS